MRPRPNQNGSQFQAGGDKKIQPPAPKQDASHTEVNAWASIEHGIPPPPQNATQYRPKWAEEPPPDPGTNPGTSDRHPKRPTYEYVSKISVSGMRYVLEVYRGIFVRWMFESLHPNIEEAEDAGRRLFFWKRHRVKPYAEDWAEFNKRVPPMIR